MPVVVREGEHEHPGGLQQCGHVLDPAGDPPGSPDDVGHAAATTDQVGVDLWQGSGVGELAEIQEELEEQVRWPLSTASAGSAGWATSDGCGTTTSSGASKGSTP